MMRWISIAALAVLLGGCYSSGSYRSYDDGYYVRDSYGEPVYVGGSSYYSPGHRGHGDYYYSEIDYGYPGYVHNPYYYSLFWPLHRWSVDPYWYPGFYYGVTYYPRSYFSIGFGGQYGRGHYRPWSYSRLAYSPYRLSWVDSYYDWAPYHRRHRDRHDHYAPRYGNARNEAAYLARYHDRRDREPVRYGAGRDGLPRTQSYRAADRSRAAVIEQRQAIRGADYGDRSGSRRDPGVSGFGYRGEPDSKRPASGRDASRAAGRERAIERPSRDIPQRAGTRYIGDSGDVRRSAPAAAARGEARSESRSAARTEIRRSSAPTVRSRSPSEYGGYRYDAGRSAAPVREVAPRQAEQPRYRSARRYDTAPAPAPRSAPDYGRSSYRAAPEPQYRSAPSQREAPRYDASPRSYSRPEPAPRESAPAREAPRYQRAEPSRREARSEGGSRGGRSASRGDREQR